MVVGVALIVAAWGIVYAWSVAAALIMTFVALVTPLSALLLLPCFGGRARLGLRSGSLAPSDADTALRGGGFLNAWGMQWLSAPSDEQ
jgi:hypothetical protein